MEFKGFGKLPRLSRDIIVTEKIDGTNAQICISEDGDIRAGSRKRWITPEDDNFGFASWVEENRDELLTLGSGRHFGEWWGCGIQRGYGLDHKRFSLFNASKWSDDQVRPSCCSVVPVLYQGRFDMEWIEDCLSMLRSCGSIAAPGFERPEGVVIYHRAANQLFKKTLDDDEVPKSLVKN